MEQSSWGMKNKRIWQLGKYEEQTKRTHTPKTNVILQINCTLIFKKEKNMLNVEKNGQGINSVLTESVIGAD